MAGTRANSPNRYPTNALQLRVCEWRRLSSLVGISTCFAYFSETNAGFPCLRIAILKMRGPFAERMSVDVSGVSMSARTSSRLGVAICLTRLGSMIRCWLRNPGLTTSPRNSAVLSLAWFFDSFVHQEQYKQGFCDFEGRLSRE